MIKVRIARDQWIQKANELNLNRAAMEQMRRAGIPVIGGLSIRGVERGRLSMGWSPDGSEMVFEWVDGPAPVAAPPAQGEDEW